MTAAAIALARQAKIARAFDVARRSQQQGRPARAARLYRGILALAPQHLAALFRLGALEAKAGNIEDAVALFRRAAAVAARSADIQAGLGVIFTRLNRPAEAIACYERALAIDPRHGALHNELGNLLYALSRVDEAVAHYEQALAIDGNDADAHNNLGNVLHGSGRLEAALAHYQRAVSIRDDHAAALNNLGSTLHALLRSAEAVGYFERALAANPDAAQAHGNFGLALAALGRTDEAMARHRQALRLAPSSADAHRNLADLLMSLDRPGEAIAAYERALAIKPDAVEICSNYANALQQLGRLDEAVAAYERALAIRPNDAKARNNLGKTLLELDRNQEAIAQFEQVLAINPASAEAQNNIGVALQTLGRLEAAAQAYAEAVTLAPQNAEIHLNLAHARRFVRGDERLVKLAALATDSARLDPDQSIALEFALAKAYADLNEPERSFAHLTRGNALKRQRTSYDEAATLRLFERVRTVLTAELMRDARGDPSTVPVFVVGMPRSGTTLVEQILASHSEVFGAGERPDFSNAAATLTPFPEAISTLSAAALGELGASYVSALRSASATAARIVDKMPINFLYVGLIHLALPNARIIHTQRQTIDTCFSCFATRFVGDQPYAYDLGELGRYYRAYAALMAHWRRVLPPGVMLEVRYEDIVDDLEGSARQMLAHCGLRWEDACLVFHATQRSVRTASAVDVRRPIYRSAIGRWRPYAHLLAPLRAALDDLCVDTA